MMRYCGMLAGSLLWVGTVQAQPAPMPSMPAMPAAPNAAAPVALPEVNVPTVAAPEAQVLAPVAPISIMQEPPAASPATAPLASEAPIALSPATQSGFSYGAADISLLYTPQQMERMKAVLAVYETARRLRGSTNIEVVEEQVPDMPGVAIEEPETYPVFTLKSIAFRNARDWTVWIGDLRITPTTNNQEVRVLAISPNRAQFLWKPVYAMALQQREALKLFAPLQGVKHKTTRVNTAIFDSASGQVTFTLLPNQAFAPAYMATFEGNIAPVKLSPITDANTSAEIAAPPPTPPGASTTSAANPANLDALLNQEQLIQQPQQQAQPQPPTLFQQTLSPPKR